MTPEQIASLAIEALWFGFVLAMVWRLAVPFAALRGWIKPWTGYNVKALDAVIKRFADSPEHLWVEMSEIPDQNFFLPILAMYEPSTCKITIDVRLVRSRRELITSLLHEVCHFNQDVHRRVSLGNHGFYLLRPIEREARAFAAAWHKIALRLYCRFEQRAKKE